MNTPAQNAAAITLNDPQLAIPLLDFLLWAVTPGTVDSTEYEDVVDLLYMKSPEYMAARDAHLESRAAAA